MRKTGIFSLASAELLVCVVGGYWLGSTLDKKFGTAPALTAILVVIGLSFSGWRIFRLGKKAMADGNDGQSPKG